MASGRYLGTYLNKLDLGRYLLDPPLQVLLEYLIPNTVKQSLNQAQPSLLNTTIVPDGIEHFSRLTSIFHSVHQIIRKWLSLPTCGNPCQFLSVSHTCCQPENVCVTVGAEARTCASIAPPPTFRLSSNPNPHPKPHQSAKHCRVLLPRDKLHAHRLRIPPPILLPHLKP